MMKPNKLLKHLKRAVCNRETRPILQCVHYDSDGSLTATDSHRLLYIKDFHEHKETFNQDIKTLEIKHENYPDVSRLIPDKNIANLKIKVSLAVLLRVAKSLKTQTSEVIKLEIKQNEIILTNQNDEIYYGEPVKVRIGAETEGEPMTISFLAKYIIEACEFLLDAKEMYALDTVDIYLFSAIRPIVMEIEDGKYMYLVTPVRNF
ncbi:DNA polymerase III subunit beta [Enterococcus faecalis]|uniref:DNA polymerase III subunit beta n=1 Tax=Enterococcus faecalis TaxID=1351 RepID=UPI0009BD24CB|nr:DNA polymerase III subunit beta [Enterococcus faecalis]